MPNVKNGPSVTCGFAACTWSDLHLCRLSALAHVDCLRASCGLAADFARSSDLAASIASRLVPNSAENAIICRIADVFRAASLKRLDRPRAMIGAMSRDPSSEDFVLSIVEVFSITGRGTAVIGPIESGVIRTGDIVEIWDGERLVCTAQATVEAVRSTKHPRAIGLRLGDIDKSLLRSGQTVRRSAPPT
jgi:GTPase